MTTELVLRHHRHFRGIEAPYGFQDVDRLIEDFRADIARLKGVKP
jgi:hypothetical protein